MKKVLISWVATNNDFFTKNEKGEMLVGENKVNENGPHINLYKDFPDFDVHYLLAQDKDDRRVIQWEHLVNELRIRFKKEVLLKFMNLESVSNVGEIKTKVYDFFQEDLKGQHVEVFINPGTPAMQTAWYLLGTEFAGKLNITFFQRKERKHVEAGVIPEKEFLNFDSSEFARVTNIRQSIVHKELKDSKKPFITDSLKEVYARAYQVAGNNRTTVLIQGDTGTGKEYLAHYIHDNSHRKSENYIAINCASYRGDLLESRLFGHEKGAFTGADKQTKGAFEDAHKGTIFLDEIGDITARMQIALLRVLEEKKISRIGSTKEIEIDVRVITASNKDLWELCKEDKFRYDLYYCLAIADLRLPSFIEYTKKERKQWIQYMLETLYTKLEKRFISTLSKEVWEFLLTYPFPGNLREVRNTVETFYTFCEEEVIIENIPDRMLKKNEEISLKLEDVIKEHIKKVVALCDGNISLAAKVLKKNRNTVMGYLK